MFLFIVDADAVVASVNATDDNRERFERFIAKCARQKAEIHHIFPATAICEAITVLQCKLEQPKSADLILMKVKSGRFKLHPIDKEIILEALNLFDPHKKKGDPSKKGCDTLFDAVVATIAKRYKADAVLSFDNWYRTIGLQLAEDVI